MRSSLVLLLVTGTFAGCGGRAPADPITTRASALTRTLASAADTFINSMVPDNNNGASPSIFTGRTGQNGVMRGLLRFAMPAELQGRVTVSGVSLAMITRGTGTTDTTPPTAATDSLQAVGDAWSEGTGFGDGPTMNTVGQACGATGATWNQANCAGGTSWAGGSVVGGVSGAASVPAAIDAVVTWDSATGGNAGLITDVQSWIDTPAGNRGWRITSSTEGAAGAQRFYAREVAANAPSLVVAAACKTGFAEVGGGCTTCTAAAMTACVTAQAGNACSDPGVPSTTYVCNCANPAYAGTGTTSCVDKNECAPNHCRDAGDATAACADAAAPASGYTCTCGGGFSFNGATCVSACGGGPDPCGAGGVCTVVGGGGGWACSCLNGYVSSGGSQPTCSNLDACNGAANTACAITAIGNACIDEAPPSLSYHCACGNAGYMAGTGGTGQPACIANPVADGGSADANDASVDGAGTDATGGAGTGAGGSGGGASGASGTGGAAAGNGGGAGGLGGGASGTGGAAGATAGRGGAAAGGRGGGAGGAGRGGSSVAGNAGGGTDGGGCSCALADRSAPWPGATLALGFAAIWFVRCRRRHLQPVQSLPSQS